MKNLLTDFKNIIARDKKIFFAIVLLFILVISSSVMAISFRPYDIDKDGTIDTYDYWLSNQGSKYINNYSIRKLPQRAFTLDMKGIPIDGATGDTDSKLKEYNSSNKKIAEWKVDIEKKGHARYGCNPPMFNMTFDKFDSEGSPKPLFPGISTFGTSTVLNYQKVRAVENCDATGDSLNNYPFFGLSGALPPQFREYIVYRTMRLLGVPSVEPIAFAKLNILNAEPKYSNTSYYYMFMQRDNELDDQIPFVRQFGLEDKLYQDGVFDWGAYNGSSYNYFEDRLVKVDLIHNQTNEQVQLNFNPEDSIRHFLLTRLINDTDRAVLHNEDYGKIVGLNKYKTILYGFDFSFIGCKAKTPDDLNLYINNISANLQPEWKAAYYKVAREMFTNNDNLFKILLAIDQYPNPVSSRSVIVAKKYMKLSFYEYGRYFNSKEFADSLGQPFAPIRFIPVMNETAYNITRADFDKNWCKQELLPAPNPVININPGNLTYRINPNEGFNSYTLNTLFSLDIEAKDQDLVIPKRNAFTSAVAIVGEYDHILSPDGYVNLTDAAGDFIDFGDYYVLRKGLKGNLSLQFYYTSSDLLNKTVSVYLKSFRPGSDYDFISLPVVKTNEVVIGEDNTVGLEAIVTSINADLVFDNLNQEVSLDANIDFKLKAVGRDVYFNENDFGHVVYVRETDLDKYPNNNSFVPLVALNTLGFEDTENINGYVLRSGQTATIKAKASSYARSMFPGTYKVQLGRLYGFDDNNNFIDANTSSTSSDREAIIGEKSPYLFSIGKGPFALTDVIEIKGERLGFVDRLKITRTDGSVNPIIINLPYLGLNDNIFKLDVAQWKLSVGDYTMQVINGKKGDSNILSFQIKDTGPVAKKSLINLMANVWHAFSSFFDVK